MQKIRILIVDDSAFMRKSLSIILDSEPDFEIVGTAKDGKEGVELAKKLKPDIITLDVEMPVMDGLSALEIIMKETPTSVIMVSSLTTEGAEATLKALELGAVDFIHKEMSFVSINITDIKDDIVKKIRTIYREKKLKARLQKLEKLKGKREQKSDVEKLRPGQYDIVAIGISTGGPLSLQKVIPKLNPAIKTPIVIVQHMPPKFTKSLADRLNLMTPLSVKEAEDGEFLKHGYIYIAKGGYHLVINKDSQGRVLLRVSEKPDGFLHKPSVDVMMDSVVDIFKKKVLGIIMTGMGKDGLEGIKKLKNSGGTAIAQDELSSVVYGMPKAIVDNNLADTVLPLEKIPEAINKLVK